MHQLRAIFADWVKNTLTSPYDAAAGEFDRHRGLPADAVDAVRAAVIGFRAGERPRVPTEAGSGARWPFANAGDDYVGLDFPGMLGRSRSAGPDRRGLRLVQADGARLLGDASFDAVMLIQVFMACRWRRAREAGRCVGQARSSSAAWSVLKTASMRE
jgi:hypothetical protein